MNTRYLVVLAIIIVSVIVTYSVYHGYSNRGSGEADVEDTSSASLNESATPSTTPSSPGPASSEEPANAMNQSSISIPLEKPPFIE
jgi:hypothetical protein